MINAFFIPTAYAHIIVTNSFLLTSRLFLYIFGKQIDTKS